MPNPPEKYEPGELQKTRSNLGDLSTDEAKEMAQRLGGEVGIEKTPEEVDREYEKLRQKAASHASDWENRRRKSRFVPASPSYHIPRKENPRYKELPRMSWGDRMKTDFLFTKPEYRAKNFGQALQSLTAFFRFVPDAVNPQFILDGDRYFAKGVEILVIAVRGLSSKSFKNAHQDLRRIPLYSEIIHLLRDWDIESINRELTQLQREPRNRSFADFEPLLKPLLRPLFRMSKLNPHVHILPAITKMFELARMYVVSKDERERLHRMYLVARDELIQVVQQLRNRLYPVLLKILSDHFLEPDQFYHEKADVLLQYLSIKEEDLLQERAEKAAATPTADKNGEEKEGSQDPVKVARPNLLAQQGLDLLEQLFPRAGWSAYDQSPDYFAYYQTVFEFPRGSDLIPVDDPLHTILPLSYILQQLFFGFQNIQWGTIKNQFGEVVFLQDQIDKSISRWHFFMEEFFGKNYLPQLLEYCREVERAGSLSPDAKRKEHQILWLKRNYLLPHLTIPVLEDVRIKSLGYPSLSLQAKEMIALLAPVAVEMEKNPKQLTALLNPDEKVNFPVATPVSERFIHVMRRILRAESGDIKTLELGTNRALIFFSLSLLSALDYFLANPDNPLYQKDQKFLYRTSGLPNDDKPVYNVPRMNTLQLLKKLNALQPPEAEEKTWRDRLPELYGNFMAQEELRRRVAEYHSAKTPFTVISFKVLDQEQVGAFLTLSAGLKEAGQTLSPQDDGTCLLILPGALPDEAEVLARKILTAAASAQPPISLAGLVIPFQKNWDMDKLLAQPERGWVLSRQMPPQILGIYTNMVQSFEFRDDLPVTQTELT